MRLETYAIKGKRKSGTICLNGPAARMGFKGDKVIILSYAIFKEEEIKDLKPKLIELNEQNKIKSACRQGCNPT